jgi:hypothetical protein
MAKIGDLIQIISQQNLSRRSTFRKSLALASMHAISTH